MTLLDIAPTIYDISNSEYIYNKNYPLKGSSILPFFEEFSENIHSKDYVFSFEHSGNSILRKGNWKIINKTNPFDKENFELFHVSDFTEQNNLINDFPNIFDSLYVEWNDFVVRNKVLLPTPYIDDLN